MADTLYYVYMKWVPADINADADQGRWLLTFKSRQDADEFYRFCLTAKVGGSSAAFASLVREGAQFWVYNNASGARGPELPRDIIAYNIAWASVCMPTLLSDSINTRAWETIPVQAASDWLSGKAFFIRNKLATSEYWYVDASTGSKVVTSTTRRTKFLIKGKTLNAGDVLIRNDTVTIEVAARASGSELYVSEADTTGNNLVLSSVAKDWTFKDLFESFGVETVTNNNSVDTHYVVHTAGSSVVWEMV